MGSLGLLGAFGGIITPTLFRNKMLTVHAACTPTSGMFDPIHWTGRELKLNDQGDEVRELQIRIGGFISSTIQQTYLKVSHIFDNATVETLKRFQSAYGLPTTGVFTAKEAEILHSLEKDDGSTLNYQFSQFYSNDGKQFTGGTEPNSDIVKENIRRLMWRLEALNKKIGFVVFPKSGFRSITHNNQVGGVTNSYHTFGCAVDVTKKEYMSGNQGFTCGLPNRGLSQEIIDTQTAMIKKIADTAKSCGFSGVREYGPTSRPIPFVHLDIRMEIYPNHWDQKWWWPEPQNNCKENSDGD
jgi:hypothetical protein